MGTSAWSPTAPPNKQTGRQRGFCPLCVGGPASPSAAPGSLCPGLAARPPGRQASPVLCSLRGRRNCPTALDINPYLFLIFPFYQRWKGEGESHYWLWNVPGSFAVAAKKQVSRRSVWAKIRGGGLGRPLVLWLRCWRALTSRTVGLFEGHMRRDVLWAPGEAGHRRTDNKWETNVVPKMAGFRVPVGCLPQAP